MRTMSETWALYLDLLKDASHRSVLNFIPCKNRSVFCVLGFVWAVLYHNPKQLKSLL